MDEDDGFDVFHAEHHDTAVRYRTPTAEEIARLRGRAPDRLVRFWTKYGWCSYQGGLLWMVNPEDFVDVQRDWGFEQDLLVIGRSGFGDMVTLFKEKLALVFVHTGKFNPSILEYDHAVYSMLSQVSRLDGYFFGDLFRQAVAKYGAPSETEMFTFEPALALGGETTLDCVGRVAMMPALSILAQLHGRLENILKS